MGGITPDDGHQLVNGRYRLVEVIGRGGMGTVWRGHDEILGREVAIKEVTLSPDLDDDERAELAALALQEARATARLNHPGIITIYDVIDDDGVPIIVMELVHGRSLADILKEEVRLPYRRVAEIGVAALEALREAHAAGVVHRDLKPANILISDRRVVITDFGVAQRVGEHADENFTVTALSPDGDLVAFGGDSGVVRLYDTATHKLRRSWKTSPSGEGVSALAFSPDGRTIAASSDDGVDI